MGIYEAFGILLGAAAVGGYAADRLVRLRSRDRGTYWSWVLVIAVPLPALALLASWLLPDLDPDWWWGGRHLMCDQVSGAGGCSPQTALWVPLGFYVLAIVVALVGKLDQRSGEDGRWLAGSIGLSRRRWWPLAFPGAALVLLIAFVLLRIQDNTYPAGVLGLLTVFAVILVLIAFSTGAADAPARPGSKPSAELPDWPRLLREHGFVLETLASYEPDDISEKDTEVAGQGGIRRIPPELRALLDNGAGNRLIAAPDHWGQIEAIAALAEQTMRRGNMVTLVVTPGDVQHLVRDLQEWTPDAASVACLDLETRPDGPAFIWIADAADLSDRLIPHLSERPVLVSRIGVIVWWNVHRYSGVWAANFWAISHRFQRILAELASPSLRHLAFVRGWPESDRNRQLKHFRELCLPQGFPAELQITTSDRVARPMSVHLICGHRSDQAVVHAPGHDADTALAATRVSVAHQWPTHLEPPGYLEEQEISAAHRSRVRGGALDEQLRRHPADAAARILEVSASDLLALPAILAQTGRLTEPGQAVHLGLVSAFGNPFVDYSLRRLRDDPHALHRGERRMVAAKPQPSVVRRHVLLALSEMPTTPSQLHRAFRWESSAAVEQVLDDLDDQHLVSTRDVRYLVDDAQASRLRPEVLYGRVYHPQPVRPLSTVGERLVDILDPGVGPVASIDPERLTIDAYPRRVFVHRGQRYRVEPWGQVDDLLGPGGGSWQVRCRKEGAPAKTWRIAAPRIESTRTEKRVDSYQSRHGTTIWPVTTTYTEDLSGYIEYQRDSHTGRWTHSETVRWPATIYGQPMSTRGILVETDPSLCEGLCDGLFSVAQALRHVMPVHVGVEDDALGVLAFDNAPIDTRIASGLLILDLYPGGIGLVQSIWDDPVLIEDLLRSCRAWLAGCCDSPEGCGSCLASPLGRSAQLGHPVARLDRVGALELLSRLLGA